MLLDSFQKKLSAQASFLASLGRWDELHALVDEHPFSGETYTEALGWAAHSGNLGSVRFLTDKNVAFSLPNGVAALTSAASSGHVDICRYLLVRGAPLVFSAPKEHYFPLAAAASFGCPDTLRLLVEYGAEPNERKGGMTALCTAVLCRHPLAVRTLLALGADPFLPDGDGDTPFDLAKRSDCGKCFEEILTVLPKGAVQLSDLENMDSSEKIEDSVRFGILDVKLGLSLPRVFFANDAYYGFALLIRLSEEIGQPIGEIAARGLMNTIISVPASDEHSASERMDCVELLYKQSGMSVETDALWDFLCKCAKASAFREISSFLPFLPKEKVSKLLPQIVAGSEDYRGFDGDYFEKVFSEVVSLSSDDDLTEAFSSVPEFNRQSQVYRTLIAESERRSFERAASHPASPSRRRI